MTDKDAAWVAVGATARGTRAVEWAICRDLVQNCGHDPGLYDLLTRADSEHRPEYVRIVDCGGQPVSLVLIVPRRVLLAGVAVEGAVVTLVGTDPAHRGKGFARLLLEDTVAFLRAKGFRVAIVQGTPGFHTKFGFVPCLGSYATAFDPRRVLEGGVGSLGGPGPGSLGGHVVWRPATDADVPEIAALYAAATAGTPGTVVRPDERWVWRDRSRRYAGLAVCRSDGGPVLAYVRWSAPSGRSAPDTLGVAEVGTSSPAALVAALGWTAGKAHEVGLSVVRFTGPPDHPFSRLAYLRAGAEVAIHPAGSGLIVTNRGLLMADLTPRLAERCLSAGLRSGTGVVLDVGAKRFELSLAGDNLRLLGGRAGRQGDRAVSRLSVEAFTAMVTGYAGGAEITALPGVVLEEVHREALSIFFPRAFPMWIPAPYWQNPGA